MHSLIGIVYRKLIFSFFFLLSFIDACSDIGYGFKSDKKIGNISLSLVSEKKEFYDLKADGYIFFFGYSRCKTTCPMGLQTFHKLLSVETFPKNILPIFVSIDIERDNWEDINRLKENFDKRILFILPKSEAELRQLTKEFEVQFSKANPTDPNYELNHTGNLYFVNSTFYLSRIFTSGHREPDKIADEIIKYYKGK